MVGRLIARQRKGTPFELELRSRNASGNTSDNRAEVRMTSNIVVEVIESEYYIYVLATETWQEELFNNAAIRQHLNRQAA
jgi:hypothetical protein